MPEEVVHYADVVVYNGKVLTADEKFTMMQAAAVRDGKFLALGDSARILKLAGPSTTRIDLQGGTMVPGFIIPHGQGFQAQHNPTGIMHLGNFTQVRFTDLDEGLRKMKAAIDKARPGEWVFLGAVRTKAVYQVTMKLLDSIAPDNPVLVTFDNTTGVVNSKAYSYIPDDVIAGVFKDEKGQPTGWIRGWAYGVLTYEILPYPEGQAYEDLIQKEKKHLQWRNSTGVTTVGNRLWGLSATILKDIYLRGESPVRIRICTEIPRLNPHLERYLKRVGNLMWVGNDWYRIAAATVSSIDSNVGNGAMLSRKPMRAVEPWFAFDEFGSNKWKDMVEPGKDWKKYSDFESFQIVARYGWNVTDIHVQGDGGVEQFLDAMDEANKTTPLKGKRYGLAHGLMRPADLAKRMAAYDMMLNFNPSYLFPPTELRDLEKQYGKDEVAGMQPVREIIDAGLKPILEAYGDAGGEDSRTNNQKQNAHLAAMQAYITRKAWPGKDGVAAEDRVVGPNQRITREEALKMATAWASRFYGDEQKLGTIEIGKLADFVILGGDFMTVPVERISDLPIQKVFVDGKMTYPLQ